MADKITEILVEARCLLASAAYSIPKGSFVAGMWVPDAEALVERINTELAKRG